MTLPANDDLRRAVARHLETDALLGLTAAPLKPPARTASPATPAAPQAASRRPQAASPAPQAPSPKPQAAAPNPQSAIRNPQSASAPINPAHIMSITAEDLAARQKALQLLDDSQVKKCTKCTLCSTRKKTVFGQGHAAPRIVFVGEAPGADEDIQGLAFVGRAGQLLTQMIAAMGLSRDEVFICNILKCRPPDNRTPAPDEISACWPYLDEQLRILRPEVIVALGKPASQTLLRTTASIGSLRGQWHDYYTSGTPLEGEPTPLMPTFHPAYLLRSPGEKAKTWSDLKLVMQRLDLPLPPPKA